MSQRLGDPCGICHEDKSKYKCPSCGILYCSLKCFKHESHVHEPSPAQQPVSNASVTESTPNTSITNAPAANDAANGLVANKSMANDATITESTTGEALPKSQSPEADGRTAKFQRIIQDDQIKSMLKFKSLQLHLVTILKIMNDPMLTNEAITENRREVANTKLCNLRVGGFEQNELVEEFVNRVIELYNQEA